MAYDFSGRVAIVTGGASGIGRAAAVAFAAAGAAVCVADRNERDGHGVVAHIGSLGGRAFFQNTDVSQPAAVEAMVAATCERYGRLDFAFNNAGISDMEKDEWDPEIFGKSIAVNLTGIMLCMKYEITRMRAQGFGAIVNTSSIHGLSGNPFQPGYCSAKHGVIGLTRTAALACARQNIRVNAVCPGLINTPMTAPIAKDDANRSLIEHMMPMGRMGRPEEIAAAVLWLCSDDSSYVNGHPLVVDGGALAV